MMNVIEIVGLWLTENGYDGLCGEECGCGVEYGLAPCGESCPECVAGYFWLCKDCDADPCEYRDFLGDPIDGCYRKIKPVVNEE